MKKYNSFSKQTIIAYIRSMRSYFFFLSGNAGLLGIIFAGVSIPIVRAVIILAILFVGWGVNQVINDLLGLKEDKINAPHRPLVTGELPIKTAIIFSFCFFILGGFITSLLNTWALVLYVFVFILNFIYEYAKQVPILGNIIFGFLLASCVYYGAMCINHKGLEILVDPKLITIAIAVVLVNITLCFYTYYKDYLGDKIAGKKTLIVLLTPERSKYLNFLISALPFMIFPFIVFSPEWQDNLNYLFFILIFISFITLQYGAFLFFNNYNGKATYYSLKWIFIGAVLFQTVFVALFNPYIAGILYLLNYFCINLLFNLHKDYLA